MIAVALFNPDSIAICEDVDAWLRDEVKDWRRKERRTRVATVLAEMGYRFVGPWFMSHGFNVAKVEKL